MTKLNDKGRVPGSEQSRREQKMDELAAAARAFVKEARLSDDARERVRCAVVAEVQRLYGARQQPWWTRMGTALSEWFESPARTFATMAVPAAAVVAFALLRPAAPPATTAPAEAAPAPVATAPGAPAAPATTPAPAALVEIARDGAVTGDGDGRSVGDGWFAGRVGNGLAVVAAAHTDLRASGGTDGLELHLVRGTALFDVQPDGATTIIVHTDRGDVRVTGTRFAVTTDAASTFVQTHAGTVRVGELDVGAGRAARMTNPDSAAYARLKPDYGDALAKLATLKLLGGTAAKADIAAVVGALKVAPLVAARSGTDGPDATARTTGPVAAAAGTADAAGPAAWLSRAKSSIEAGAPADALALLDRLLAEAPAAPQAGEARLRRAQALARLDRGDDARAAYEQAAAARGPDGERALIEWGRFERDKRRDHASADAVFDRYLKEHPQGSRRADALYELCVHAGDAGRGADTGARCTAYLNEGGDARDRARAHYTRGMARLGAGNAAEAVSDLEAAVQGAAAGSTDRNLARHNLGMCLIKAGQADRGRAELRALLAEVPDWKGRAEIERALGTP